MLMGWYCYSDSTYNKRLLVIEVPGMSGCLQESMFSYHLSKALSKDNTGYIYGHHRHYGDTNDGIKTDGTRPRGGASYECFDDCYNDINAWYTYAKNMGYEHIILLAHSLGAPKLLAYQERYKRPLKGIILSSPADMIGIILQEMGVNAFHNTYNKALDMIQNGLGDSFVMDDFADWIPITAHAFVSLHNKDSAVNQLSRTKTTYIESIDIPILVLFGDNDIAFVDGKDNTKAYYDGVCKHSKYYRYSIIDNADHCYYPNYDGYTKVITVFLKTMHT